MCLALQHPIPANASLSLGGLVLTSVSAHRWLGVYWPADVDFSGFLKSRLQLASSAISQLLGFASAHTLPWLVVCELFETQVDSLLEELHISHLRKQPSTSLSGGERRRVEIARALASRPAFMLLDEPFTGIDPLAISDISDLVGYLKQRGLGVLITDHQVRETLQIVDRASIIYEGSVLFEGAPEEVLKNEDVRRDLSKFKRNTNMCTA